MYIFARLSSLNAKRLRALADKKGTTVAAFAGAILVSFLNGQLAYIKKNDRVKAGE